MTLVTGTIKDVSGSPDNSEWRFSTILRENLAGTQIVSTKTVLVKPVLGVFSQAIEPGYVIVNYKGKDYPATLPNQTSIDVWDLIAITAPLPPSTVSAFGNSLATSPNAADARTQLSAEYTGNKGAVNGYASLDATGKIPTSQLSVSAMEYKGAWNATTNTPTLANGGSSSTGDVYRVSTGGTAVSLTVDAGDFVVYNGSTWEKWDTTDAVSSVAGRTGAVTLTSTDVGLANVNNTSDATKDAAATALTNKTSVTSTGAVTGSTLVSTVATGTAPLTVTSTTVVPNLNAQLLNGIGQTISSTASTVAARDGNAYLVARGFLAGFTTTATAAGTTTLTAAASATIQEFTGTLAQTVVLPTTSVVAGQQFTILNNSTGLVTVQSSALATIHVLAPGAESIFTALVATPTTAAHWEDSIFATSYAAGKSLTVNNNLTLAGTDGTTMTFPATSGSVVTGTASAAATGSTLALRDGNGLLFSKSFIPQFLTTATAAGTTTLLVNSNAIQEFTGTLAQTVVLPTTSVSPGQTFTVINNSTGAVTVQSSALATIGSALTTGQSAEFIALIATPTTAANWHRR